MDGNTLNVLMNIVSVVLGGGGLFLGVMFYRWGRHENEKAAHVLNDLKNLLGQIQQLAQLTHEESERARNQITTRILDILDSGSRREPVMQAQQAAPPKLPVSLTTTRQLSSRADGPPDVISAVTKAPALATRLQDCTDEALLLLFALQTVQSRYSPVEKAVLQPRSTLAEDAMNQAATELVQKGVVEEDGHGLKIREDLFRTVTYLFDADVPYGARTGEILRGIRDRLHRIAGK